MKLFYLFAILIGISSCSTYSDEELLDFDQQIESYLSEKNIECERSESGLYYKIINQGEGQKIKYKDIISFKYRGELLNGLVFDEQKDPVEFKLEQLIACWKEIILELNTGGKAFIVSPPQLGYGDHDLENIPKNSILTFEIEVTDVK
ncbi:MAG: FKBP-type peptidyl-prolyl cis-trans isomerase [Flavobacteriales bacterium]|nr:FKBP-type peptidyl-prolyl cis-trans isomerase [Flavobacteriales bacterium]